MKNLILFALAVLIYGCSKDEESKPAPTVTDPELEVWVYSNSKYPYLKVYDDTVLTADINNNDTYEQVMPARYFRDKLTPGHYIFGGLASQDNYPKLDNDTVWVRLVVIVKNDTLMDSTRRAPVYAGGFSFVYFNDTIN